MPELPEVETTVTGLRTKVLNRTFVDVWSDWEKMVRLRSAFGGTSARQVKRPKDFSLFKRQLKGKKIQRIWRRAKNVLFELSDGYTLLVHMKMTGHLMVGKWKKEGAAWLPLERGPFEEKINLFIHFLLTLDDGQMIAMSDYRKFAKAELWKTEELLGSKEFMALGPEPLEASFTFEKFKGRFAKKRGRIKQIIMDPSVIAGVGNIYASEALWWARLHPEKDAAKLSDRELKSLYAAIKKVLQKGIDLGGESFADYRNIAGEKGNFDDERKAYKREKLPCYRCKTPIKRIMHNGRSAFYCPTCQKQ